EFPISLRWRNSSPDNHQFWRVYTGFKLQRNFFSKLKYSSGDIKNISDEVNNWKKELYLSFGYNTWNFYFSYDLNQVMKNFRNQYSGKPFNIRSLKIGLIFFIL
ncbi:PorT family protein, partial [Flavobacteriaceae bacterium]|nr:PorT family protein [Flavobacteriaceae bacterium]